LDLLEIIVRHS